MLQGYSLLTLDFSFGPILSLAFRELLPSQSDPWASGTKASVGLGVGGEHWGRTGRPLE